MAQQGWYPDPGGQAGMYRYWDGQAWSSVLSPSPLPGPPPEGGGPQPLNVGWGADAGSAYSQFQAMEKTKAKKPIGLWISIIVGVLVVSLVAYFIITRIGGGPIDPNQTDPINNPTTQPCPSQTTTPARAEHPTDGRVYGGKLSYPKLPSPWGDIKTGELRLPFGRDIAEQEILIHTNPNPNPFDPDDWSGWVISVLVGELYAGDGFYAPEPASDIVNRCIFGGGFYGDTKLTAETLRSEAYSVDGYDGWITETNLHFSIPNLPTTSELAIVIIVQTSVMSSSIFYASIPNDAVQYKPDVDAAIADLHVVP